MLKNSPWVLNVTSLDEGPIDLSDWRHVLLIMIFNDLVVVSLGLQRLMTTDWKNFCLSIVVSCVEKLVGGGRSFCLLHSGAVLLNIEILGFRVIKIYENHRTLKYSNRIINLTLILFLKHLHPEKSHYCTKILIERWKN